MHIEIINIRKHWCVFIVVQWNIPPTACINSSVTTPPPKTSSIVVTSAILLLWQAVGQAEKCLYHCFILATVRLTRHCHHQDKLESTTSNFQLLTAYSLQDSYLIQSTWICSDFKLCVSNYSSNYDLALKTQGDNIPYAILPVLGKLL